MKKRIFLILLLIGIIAVSAVACTVDWKPADVKVTSIAVDGITKTVYVACDELNLNGATLVVSYDDGTNGVFPLTADMLDPTSYDMNRPGEQKVRVVYEGQSATFTITVLPWELTGVELDSVPYVLDYVVGEEIDTAGATIKCS
ncbi:MAG: bacterial Ig-like domain-containing protein, partial [Christensenellales bacterium]